jgi:hypothetical protein
MRGVLLGAVCSAAVMLGGCQSEPRYTQAQLNALETREIDAPLAETFTAASNALFDAGYTISMSDRAGGLVTGTKRHDRKRDEMFVKKSERWREYTLSVQVRRLEPKLSAVRVKSAVNGEPRVDRDTINEFWVLMQRQVLMHEPLPRPEIAE